MSSLLAFLALLTPLLDLEETITVPEVGDHELILVTPRVLELRLTNTQATPENDEATTSPTVWDFLSSDARKANAPTLESFEVQVGGEVVPVIGIGFQRQPRYAPLGEPDLRVGNAIYLLLEEGVPLEAEVLVQDSSADALDYLTGMEFKTVAMADRVSAAIHVSQVGFEPTYESGMESVKQGFVSLYLGDLGLTRLNAETGQWELEVFADAKLGTFSGQVVPLGVDVSAGFEIVDALSGEVVYPPAANPEAGAFAEKSDVYWPSYRSVLEADFSDLVRPGHYRLRVAGLGASLPFRIQEGVASTLARTMSLGVFHQRSAQDHALPYTRFIDGPGHTEPAYMPFDDVAEDQTYKMMIQVSDDFFNREDTVHPAPQIRSAETMLYPYVGDVLGWWPLDEAEGLRDLAAVKSVGQRFGGIALAETGMVNGALQFDGVDDSVSIRGLSGLEEIESLTLSFWVRMDALDREQVLFSKGSAWECRYDPTTKGLVSKFGDISVPAPWRMVGDGEWHFVVFQFEAEEAGGMRWFVDHEAAGESVSTVGMSAFPTGGTAPFLLGNEAFHGALDDVRMRESIVSGEELIEASEGKGPWIDVSKGHFDAGDYSKYMKNSGLFLHVLTFMIDQGLEIGTDFPQAFDHLGIPESGDGISDLIQEAKWEADYIAKMQDTDGGFFSMVNPRTRRFENELLPSEGDRQVVWPKTLIASGIAVGSLAQLGHSPAFKAAYPEEAQRYREKALRGWDFIESAVAKHGVLGGHQRIYHYGDRFDANDELAYAAAALFAMTGEAAYEARMMEWMPYDLAPFNTSDVQGWRSFRNYTWQRLYESVGAAMRTYAFSNRGAFRDQERNFSGQLIQGKRYVDHVLEEIIAGGDDQVSNALGSPFGASVPSESKRFEAVVYFFAASEAFDLVAASLLSPKPEYTDALQTNVSFQAGGNPVNTTFLSGLGWIQPRNLVSQWAVNDERKLPPIGFNSGSVNMGLPYLDEYRALLGLLTYPPHTRTGLYAFPHGSYHRYADTFHLSNEFVILDHGRSLAAMTYLMAAAGDHEGPWESPPEVTITGLPTPLMLGESVELGVSSPSDLSEALVIWEGKEAEPQRGTTFNYRPANAGTAWVELEVLWPDGRRSFARETRPVRETVLEGYVENFQPATTTYGPEPYRKVLGNPAVKRYYPLDGDLEEALGGVDDRPLELLGNAQFAASPFDYPGYETTRPSHQLLRFEGAGDAVELTYGKELGLFPEDSKWISVEAMLYIEDYAPAEANSDLLSLMTNRETRLRLARGLWDDRSALELTYSEDHEPPTPLPLKQWMHVRSVQDETTASLYVNGERVLSVPNADLDTWVSGETSNVLRLGDFTGWVSDIVLKASPGPLETADPIKEIVPGGPLVVVEPPERLDVVADFTPGVTLADSEGNEGNLIFLWSGPEGVTFEPDDVLAPEVRFRDAGDYELKLEVTNEAGISRTERVFVSVRNLSGNETPQVDAGSPASIMLSAIWRPEPTLSDDGAPEGLLKTRWTQVSGPSEATLDDPEALRPTIEFTNQGVYVFEFSADDSLATGRDRVSVAVFDPIKELVPGTSFELDDQTIALYHFDGNLEDASGRGYDLSSQGGAPTFSDNVQWMVNPEGTSVAFAALGQQLEVSLPDALILPNDGDGFTVEWRFYVIEDLAYSITTATLLGLVQNHDSRVRFLQYRWDLPKVGAIDFGSDTIIEPETFEPYLPKETWIDMKLIYDAAGDVSLFTNSQLVVEFAAEANRGRDEDWVLTLGNFEGYIDELRISEGVRPVTPPNRAPLIAMNPGMPLPAPTTISPRPAVIDDAEDELTYTWSVVAGDESLVSFSDSTALDSEVTFAERGLFTLALTANDGQASTQATSEWRIGESVLPTITLLENDITLEVNEVVVPEVEVEEVELPPFIFAWSVTLGDEANVLISDSTSLSPSIQFGSAGEYELELKVADGELASVATYRVTVKNINEPPNVRLALDNLRLEFGESFVPGIVVEDEDPSALTYAWTVLSGPGASVRFSDPASLAPTIMFLLAGEYALQVSVSDGEFERAQSLQVTVLPQATPLERWRSRHFSPEVLATSALEETVWGSLADPDGDKRVNLLEAYAGTDPQTANPGPFLETMASQDGIILRWERATDTLGIRAEILVSEDLQSFETMLEAPEPEVMAESLNRQKLQLTLSREESGLFMRLGLIEP